MSKEKCSGGLHKIEEKNCKCFEGDYKGVFHKTDCPQEQEPIEWESELRKEFHSFSVKMAQDVEERLLNYSEVEGMIVDFWLSQIKQAEERERSRTMNIIQKTKVNEGIGSSQYVAVLQDREQIITLINQNNE